MLLVDINTCYFKYEQDKRCIFQYFQPTLHYSQHCTIYIAFKTTSHQYSIPPILCNTSMPHTHNSCCVSAAFYLSKLISFNLSPACLLCFWKSKYFLSGGEGSGWINSIRIKTKRQSYYIYKVWNLITITSNPFICIL